MLVVTVLARPKMMLRMMVPVAPISIARFPPRRSVKRPLQSWPTAWLQKKPVRIRPKSALLKWYSWQI